ncbi:hypothetical protein KP509_1Z310100 [Ceratopteris richardii]|nr:hypothetical protein KP509_1Z310100 [Ceratopteris richardii]
MPRKEGIEWDYVEKVKALPKGNWTVKCNFCAHTWDGGANRIRAHILALKGYGVGKCDQVPQHVKDSCKKVHARISKHSFGESHVLRSGESVGEPSPCDDLDIGLGESSSGHASKRSRGHVGPLDKAFDSQIRDDAYKVVRRFSFAEDIPFWKVRSPYFLEMLHAVGRVGTSFKAPSYQRLRGV